MHGEPIQQQSFYFRQNEQQEIKQGASFQWIIAAFGSFCFQWKLVNNTLKKGGNSLVKLSINLGTLNNENDKV